MPSFRILGPIEAEVNSHQVPLGRRQQRAVLAFLLLSPNRVVPQDVLVEALWDNPPETAVTALHGYVSGLRKALGPAVIETRPPGYVLHLEPSGSDLDRFEQAVGEADRLEPRRAAEVLADALSLWRGRALADVDDFPFARTEQRRLEELRLLALEQRIAADLELGRHAGVVAELETLVGAHPLRERFRELFMLALYRAGRQADALQAYRDGRRLLLGQLGLEPSVRLKQLERGILEHDPALSPPQPERSAGQGNPRRRFVVAAGVAAIVIATAVISALVSTDGGRHNSPLAPPVVVPNSLVELDPKTGAIRSVTPVGVDPASVAVSRGFVWIVNRGDRTVTRIDARTLSKRTVGIPFAYDVAAGPGGTIWVSSSRGGVVSRITTGTGGWPSFRPPPQVQLGTHAGAIAAGAGELWVANGSNVGRSADTVSRIDLGRRKTLPRITVGQRPLLISFGYGAAWISNYDSETISVIRPGSSHPNTIRLLNFVDMAPLGITTGANAVWVVTGHSELIRINPDTLRIVARIKLGLGSPGEKANPMMVAANPHSVWVTQRSDTSVAQIDPRTNRVRRVIPLGVFPVVPCGIAATPDAIWVTIGSDIDCGTPHPLGA